MITAVAPWWSRRLGTGDFGIQHPWNRSAPVLGKEHGDGEGGGKGGAGEVDGIVTQAAGTLKGGSQQAVDDGSEEGSIEHGKAELRQQKIGPLAGGADDEDGTEGQRWCR